MKNVKFLLTAILASSLLFFSCEKDDNSTSAPQSDLIAKSSFIGVGQKHNDGLAQIYTALVNSGPLNKQTFIAINKQTGANYLASQGIGNQIYNTTFGLNQSNIDFTSATEIYNNNVFSPALKSELMILEAKFENMVNLAMEEATDETIGMIADQVFNYTHQIVNQPPSTLQTSKDRLAWQHAVEVMGYSCVYWSENMVNWMQLNPNSDGSANRGLGSFLKKAWNFIKPTVKADAVGAATGALGGILGGPGGVAGGALGGGLGASAGNVIERLWP